MKITYEFDPFEDKENLAIFQNAQKYYSAIYEVTLLIRNFRKYNENTEAPLPEQIKILNELIDRLETETSGMGYWELT